MTDLGRGYKQKSLGYNVIKFGYDGEIVRISWGWNANVMRVVLLPAHGFVAINSRHISSPGFYTTWYPLVYEHSY
jgi:hypothetical protein